MKMNSDATVNDYVAENSWRWLDRDNDYWLERLKQEVEELEGVINGTHEDPIEHELKQIASIAINWLSKLEREKKKLIEIVSPIEFFIDESDIRAMPGTYSVKTLLVNTFKDPNKFGLLHVDAKSRDIYLGSDMIEIRDGDHFVTVRL